MHNFGKVDVLICIFWFDVLCVYNMLVAEEMIPGGCVAILVPVNNIGRGYFVDVPRTLLCSGVCYAGGGWRVRNDADWRIHPSTSSSH